MAKAKGEQKSSMVRIIALAIAGIMVVSVLVAAILGNVW